MNDLIVKQIYAEMCGKISMQKLDDGRRLYWYDRLWKFEKVKNLSVLESFFHHHPALANEYFDAIFDQIHPY
jgi:hypothetical protein